MATTRKEHRAKIAEARNVLGEVISRARYAGETTVLMNRGKEAAVLVPYDWYKRALEALGEEPVLVHAQDVDGPDMAVLDKDGNVTAFEIKSTHRPRGR